MPNPRVIVTDRASLAADYATLTSGHDVRSAFEGDDRNPGVPRHVARQAGGMIAVAGVGDGRWQLGGGWAMEVAGGRVTIEGPSSPKGDTPAPPPAEA